MIALEHGLERIKKIYGSYYCLESGVSVCNQNIYFLIGGDTDVAVL